MYEIDCDANYQVLANAIIEQACNDYQSAIRGMCDNPEELLEDTMRFFESEWYMALTTVDYRFLIETMDKEYVTGQRLIEAGMEVDCPNRNEDRIFTCPLCGRDATTRLRRYTGCKRKDGARKMIYRRTFVCECHIPEALIVKVETVYRDKGDDTNEK